MDFDKAPTAANLENYIRKMLRAHPHAQTFSIGSSSLGRRISVLTLGNTCGCALFVGATHGSEWLTALLLLRFFDEVCSASPVTLLYVTHLSDTEPSCIDHRLIARTVPEKTTANRT